MSTANIFQDFYSNFASAADASAIAESSRSNIESNIEAGNKVFQLGVETLQALTSRSTEIARKNSEQFLAAAQDAATSSTPEAGLARTTEATKSLVEESVADSREAIEKITKASFEAFDIISSRAQESIAELSEASSGTKKRK